VPQFPRPRVEYLDLKKPERALEMQEEPLFWLRELHLGEVLGAR